MQTRCPADLAVRFERQREVLTREPGPLLAKRTTCLERLRTLLDANETTLVHAIGADIGERSRTGCASPIRSTRRRSIWPFRRSARSRRHGGWLQADAMQMQALALVQ